MQFVIQEHRSGSNKVRYYLRLEKDGVFKGWAISKGLPEKWKKQHLAIQVGNFKLETAGFEGKVKESKFGPGTIAILDRGEYRVRSWEDDKIIFDLSGSRATGSFALIRFPRPGPGHWLLGQTKPFPPSPSLKKLEETSKRKGSIKVTQRRKPKRKGSIKVAQRRKPKRKGSIRLTQRRDRKSPVSAGYSGEDWLSLLAFITIGIVILAILVVLIF